MVIMAGCLTTARALTLAQSNSLVSHGAPECDRARRDCKAHVLKGMEATALVNQQCQNWRRTAPQDMDRHRNAGSRAMMCAAAVHDKPVATDRMLVYVPPHPLIKHFVAVLRNELTPSVMFKSAMGELGRLLIYEASRDWLPTISGDVQTPCGVAAVEFIDPGEPVQVIPILRAGLVLAEHVGSVLPATQTYHIGYSRDEETLLPTLYLNKLPDTFAPGSRVLVVDPMLATGGTIVAAIEEITSRGADPKFIRVIGAVAAPPALEKLSRKFPGLQVYVGIIDEELNDKGFIVPGFGDAGDRSFNT